ncbi:OmpA family protein [Rhodocaloribacter sp.]
MPERSRPEPDAARPPEHAAEPVNGGPEGASSREEDLEALRRLLLAPEQSGLREVRERLERLVSHEEQVERVAGALPEAVARQSRRDRRLAEALAPTIEETLKLSVERNPQPLVDAIFPVIGPAIRKSIAEALRSFLESVNRTLEHSLSLKSFRWRLEALRTGRSFSEVVLSHTLLYRVEQIFLIDRKTGLPLQHLFADAVETQDGSLVSGMLTAIQDFVQDSFGAEEEEVLDAIEMGDLTVWIEEGPKALVAAVIRGVPAPALRNTLKDLIETIHLRFREELEAFDGDPEPFERARPILESALVSKTRSAPERRRSAPAWIAFGAAVVVLGVWLFFTIRERQWWHDYVARLDAEPGIVVTDAGRSGGAWYVRGLRDPLAADPAALRAETPLRDAEVVEVWEPYQALAPEILARRAARLLDAPPSVTFRMTDGVLHASGTAPAAWIEETRARAGLLPGVTGYDDAALAPDESAFKSRIDALERQGLRFIVGTTRLAPGQEAALNALAAEVRALFDDARALGKTVRLQILGHASADGPPAVNQRLSRQRAEAVRATLIARGLPAEALEAVGTGRPRFPDAATDEQRAQNRSVSYRVVVE